MRTLLTAFLTYAFLPVLLLNYFSINRHVVLGLHHYGKFGTLGLSRRDDLMFKPLKFKVGRLNGNAQCLNPIGRLERDVPVIWTLQVMLDGNA